MPSRCVQCIFQRTALPCTADKNVAYGYALLLYGMLTRHTRSPPYACRVAPGFPQAGTARPHFASHFDFSTSQTALQFIGFNTNSLLVYCSHTVGRQILLSYCPTRAKTYIKPITGLCPLLWSDHVGYILVVKITLY